MGKLLAGAMALAFLLGADRSFPTPFRFSTAAVPLIGCTGGNGSGVRISDDVVITARHVAENGSCRIGMVPLALVHVGEGDFAAFKGDLPYGHRATVSCEGINAGQRYVAVGYPFGEAPVFEPLIGTDKTDKGMRRMAGRVYPGMSGGGVFDEDGRVVAITLRYHKEVSWAWVYELKDTYLCSAN